MKKALAITSASLAALALPLISSAATTITDLNGVGNFIINTINGLIVPILFAIAFIVFVYGAFETFIIGANKEEVKEKGKNLMLWGLIGFFVMVSVWGLVNILTSTVSFGNNGGISNPPKAGVNIGN